MSTSNSNVMPRTTESSNPSPDHALVLEAQKRFRRASDWEDDARKLYKEDLKFSNGDSDNGYQWPDAQRKTRDFDAKPCLTINKTFQHNLLIINDIRQNMPTPTVHPVGDEGTYKSAEVFQDLIRHVEYQSNARAAYQTAVEQQVQGGIGYWRIVTDYADENTFDQEIFVRRIKDGLSVLLDPDCNESDGSDAQWGFVFSDYSFDNFKQKFGKEAAEIASSSAGVGDGDTWILKDTLRVAEYYKKEYTRDELWAVPNAMGTDYGYVKKSEIPENMMDSFLEREGIKRRPIKTCKVLWYLIAGATVLEKSEIPCDYIPIVRCIGWETIIDGKLDRKGHTRQLKDPNRMYNYWASSSVEYVALQGKQPYIGPLRAFEGLEKYWQTSNLENYAYMPFNDIDDAGQPIAAPQRQQPPVMAQGYIQGLQNASNEMAMVSGQYQNQFGAPGPEEAGVAIQMRRRQGGISTFHYSDNFAASIRFSCRILINMIPRVYDTKRVLRVIGVDGKQSHVTVDPTAQQGVQEQRISPDEVRVIFNPNVGKFDVVAEAGPNYQTRREEAFAAMTQIIGQNEKLLNLCGDLMFKSADFPLADEIAERLARTIPEEIKTGQPNPQVVTLQKQVQQLETMLQTAQYALKEKSDKTEVESYRATTDRMHALLDHESFDPREAKALIMATVAEALQGVLPLPPTAPNGGVPPNGANPPPAGQPVPANPSQGAPQ
jgi:hypothetical protein